MVVAWIVLRRCAPQENPRPQDASSVTKQKRLLPPELPAIRGTPPIILPVASEAARLNDPDLTAADDLAILTTMLGEYRRHLGGNPVGDNDEITAALLGANPKRLACLPTNTGRYLDNAGRLIDRWGAPYFFHALSLSNMEILSAGPDSILYTADDLRGGDAE
ncbi:MAG: hypothetical protein WED15_01135 [Akkermansiaceae bacterium]